MKNVKFTFFATALLTVGVSSSAFAQDDPFSAYSSGAGAPPVVVEEQVTETLQTTPEVNPVAPPAYVAPSSGEVPEYVSSGSDSDDALEQEVEYALGTAEALVQAGRFSLNSNLGFALDYATSELKTQGGGGGSFFTRFDLGVGYNLFERVKLELTAGAMLRMTPLDSGSATEHDWVFQINGFYHYPWKALSPNVSLLGGGGMGAYFGGFSNGPSDISTSGFIGNLKGGVGYLFAENFNFRILLNGTIMVGIASPVGGANYVTSTSHLGIDLGLTYSF